jgi:hypothetical protein
VVRHQRKATLPAGDFIRPSSVNDTGLIVTLYGEGGGVEGTFDFTGLNGSLRLRQAFAAALDRKAGPGGTWRSDQTCRSAFQDIRAFLRWIAACDDPPQEPAEISPAIWSQWCMSLPDIPRARHSRRQMRVLMAELVGLPAETRKVVDRRIPKEPPPKEVAYSYPELAQIRARASTIFNTALVRIRTNRELLRRWYAGELVEGDTDWLIGEALDCLSRTGDLPRRKGGGGSLPSALPARFGRPLA